MKHLLLITLFLGTYISIFSQAITIKSQENGQPLEFVLLSSNDPKASAITDVRGQADMSTFRGAEKIEIRLIGYETLAKSYRELEQADFLLSLSPSSFALDQVVVTASRWNQSRRDIPARITTITQREVALQNPQTAADLLGSSGEVFIQKSQQGGGSPMIRGFSTNRLLITVDGVRMNTAIFRSGNLQNVISLDPFAVEKTEVLFGPGSVIYGSDAIGGVMGFYTLTPQFAATDETLVNGSAVVRYASANNEFTGHADVRVGWKKWALASSFSHNKFGDLRMGSHGPEEYLRPAYVQRVDSLDRVFTNDDPLVQRPSAYEQTNLMQKLRFRPNDNWEFNYGFHYSTTTDYSRYDRLLRTRRDLPRSAEWYYGPQVWLMNNLNITHHGRNGFYDQATLRLAQQSFEESRIDRDFNDAERRSRLEKVDALSANLDLQKNIGLEHRLLYGLEAIYNEVNSSGTDEDISSGKIIPGPARYPQSTWASYAAYLTYQYRASERLLLQAGGRYNQFALDAAFDTTFYPFPFTTAQLNKGAFTGSAGVVYSTPGLWTWSANLSTGFRSPNVDDLGKVFDSEPGAVVVPNPNLSAEYAYNAEIGLAKVAGDAVRVDLSAYYTMLDNALVRRNFTLNGQDSILYAGELSRVQAVQNAAKAHVYGLQAAVEVKFSGGFSLLSRFNYQQGEEELDDGSTSPLRHAAPWFGMTRLTYANQKLKLELSAVYSGEVSYENLAQEERGKDYLYALNENGNPYSPGWYSLNFKTSIQLTEQLSITGGVENLTDQRYRPYSSGLAAAGRNVVLSFRAGF